MTAQFLAKYGNPDINGDMILDQQWFDANISLFALPFMMLCSWPPYATVMRFQAHRFAGPRIIDALKLIAEKHGLNYLRENKLDRWGGCFNFRAIRGGTDLSVHSWGAAVDLNPDIGRLGNAEDAKNYPRFIVEAFEECGFSWGGLWARPDSMHFELEN